MPPEEFDIEEYLERIKRRWDSSLLSDEQNKKIRDDWDDSWMIPDENPKS
jgi:hypothetical protein